MRRGLTEAGFISGVGSDGFFFNSGGGKSEPCGGPDVLKHHSVCFRRNFQIFALVSESTIRLPTRSREM